MGCARGAALGRVLHAEAQAPDESGIAREIEVVSGVAREALLRRQGGRLVHGRSKGAGYRRRLISGEGERAGKEDREHITTYRASDRKRGRDGTAYYSDASGGFLSHHLARISVAAVYWDAQHIDEGVRFLKQRAQPLA